MRYAPAINKHQGLLFCVVREKKFAAAETDDEIMFCFILGSGVACL
jgi:hypothetical protein